MHKIRCLKMLFLYVCILESTCISEFQIKWDSGNNSGIIHLLSPIKIHGFTVTFFSYFNIGKKNSDIQCAFSDEVALPKKGSTLKGRNLLIGEHILSFKR